MNGQTAQFLLQPFQKKAKTKHALCIIWQLFKKQTPHSEIVAKTSLILWNDLSVFNKSGEHDKLVQKGEKMGRINKLGVNEIGENMIHLLTIFC